MSSTPTPTIRDPEAVRILSLPRTVPVDGAQIEALSSYCRLREHNDAGERNLLRPQQVQLLRDLWELPGVFADMPVGAGKTLPLMLAPFLLRAERPMMLLPADLFRTSDKTQRDFARYRRDWRVLLPELRSFEEMARKDREHDLTRADPDLLLADEADPLRNDRNAVTRRVKRFRYLRPAAKFCFASGTLITDALMDYAHLSAWTLAQYSPAPLRPDTVATWAEALDKNPKSLFRPSVPELAAIPGGFHEWFRGSRGVVCGAGVQCPQPIRIQTWAPELPDELLELIADVEITGLRPDGEDLDDLQKPETLCSLVWGLYHVWDPLPPDWWLRPRRAYYAYLREVHEAAVTQDLPGLDTQDQIETALDRPPGAMVPDPWGRPVPAPVPPNAGLGRQLLAEWRAVKDRFEPNSVARWVNRDVVKQIAARVEPRHWLIWTPWPALGRELEALGIPYYGGGTNPETADGRTIAVAVKAHHRGKNLQRYHKNLILRPSPSARLNEQTIGRTHRTGQKHAVGVVYTTAIDYHGEVLGRAYASALKTSADRGSPQKLVLADWI